METLETLRAEIYENSSDGRKIIHILGATGAGKTRSLQFLRAERGRRNCIYVPATRRHSGRFKINPLREDGRGIDAPKLRRGLQEYSDEGAQIPANLFLEETLKIIASHRQKAYSQHEQALGEWDRGGAKEAKPEFLDGYYDQIDNAIFRMIGYRLDVPGPHERYRDGFTFPRLVRGDVLIDRSQLSSGERLKLDYLPYVLAADGDEDTVFLIDEPELHLNDLQATELWESIENSNKSATFVYSTHSVVFATRPQATATLVLTEYGKFERQTAGIDGDHLAFIAGTRLQILSTDRPIVLCEDDQTELTLAAIFGESIAPSTRGGSDPVFHAIRDEPQWHSLRSSSGNRLIGVVDRDTRSDREAENGLLKGVIFTPTYDIEGLLMDYTLISKVLEVEGKAPLSEERFLAHLRYAAERALDKTRRCIAHNYVRKYASADAQRRDDEWVAEIDLTEASSAINDRMQEVERALAQGDAADILRLFHNKKMIGTFVSKIDPRSEISYLQKPIHFIRKIADTPTLLAIFRKSPMVTKLEESIRRSLPTSKLNPR